MIPIAGRGQRALLRFGAMEVVERFSRTVVGRKDWSNEGEPKVRLGWDGMGWTAIYPLKMVIYP